MVKHICIKKCKFYLALVIILAITSCQKAQLIDSSPKDGFIKNEVSQRSSIEGDVVSYAQFLIDKVAPLVSDPETCQQLIGQNYHSIQVKSKLLSLGFSSYEEFSGIHLSLLLPVANGIQQGILSEEDIISYISIESGNISINNIFELYSAGNVLNPQPLASALPCYEEFMVNVTNAILTSAACAFGGPEAAAACAIVGIWHAYNTFKTCVDTTYG